MTLLQVCFALFCYEITMCHSWHIRILVTGATSDKKRQAKSIFDEVRLQIDNTKTAINATDYRS